MTDKNLLIFNHTTFSLPETVPTVSTIIPLVLNGNQKLRRKGYSSQELLISIEDVYKWITGLPLLSLSSSYNLEVPGAVYDTITTTCSYIEIHSTDPYPVRLPNSTAYIKHQKNYTMLKHIYRTMGTNPQTKGRIIKGIQKAIKLHFKKNLKTVLLLSFTPELRPIAEFILYHLRDRAILYAFKNEFPKLMELSTIEFNDAQSRKIMAMYTEDIALSYNRSSRKVYISHINTSAHRGLIHRDASSLSNHIRINTADFIFDLSNVDFGSTINTDRTPEDITNARLKIVEEAFKKVEEDFVTVCLEKITASN